MVVMLADGWLLPAEGTRFSQNQLTGAKTEISQLCDEPLTKFDNDITMVEVQNMWQMIITTCLNVILVGEGL